MRTALLIGLLLLPATGCLFFSEKPRAYSTVTLRFAAPSDQAQADIPVSAPDAQDGLRIVKDVMASSESPVPTLRSQLIKPLGSFLSAAVFARWPSKTTCWPLALST